MRADVEGEDSEALKIYVPSHGNTKADIFLCGEGPGGDEERYGRPFCGVSGNELDRMLHDAGIPRSACFTSNVVRYRPPGNDISEFIQHPKKKIPCPQGFIPYSPNGTGMRWVADFVPKHVEELRQEILNVRPKVVVALGNTPMWALTGMEGITTWRSSILDAEVYGHKFKLIPVLHPAYILRSWAERYCTVEDFRRVLRESKFPEIRKPAWRFIISPTLDQVREWYERMLSRLAAGPVRFTCDIETRNNQIACVGIGNSKLDAICIPFMAHSRGGSYWTLVEEMAVISLLREILNHPNARIINQNFLYDAFFFASIWGLRAIPWMDTQIAHHTCWPGTPKALDYQASIYCEYYRYWKGEGRDWDPKKTPEESLWSYNCEDCVYTWEISEVHEEQIFKLGLKEQYEFQMSQFPMALDMMLTGLRTDGPRRESLARELGTEMDKRQTWLNTVLGQEVNLRSHQQMQELFYGVYKIPPILHRKTRRPTVDDDALEKIAKKEPLLAPVVANIQEFRTLGILKSTFVEAGGPIDRFYCSINLCGAETFRYSTSKNPFGWGSNSQNIPHAYEDAPDYGKLPDIRKMFVPDEGYIFLECDLERADLQVVVWEADDPILKQMLREGADIHTENAKVVGMPRQEAKKFVHGTNYGGSARTMAINCGVTIHQAELAQSRWFREHWWIKAWHKRIESGLIQTRSVRNVWGYRRFYFDRLDGLLPQALAWQPQSTVAITVNKGLMKLYNSRPDIPILIQVHDSGLLQLAANCFPSDCRAIKTLMEVPLPYPDPLTIPVEVKYSKSTWADVEKMKL